MRDYYGLSAEGFATLLTKAGITNPFKDKLNEYKSAMEKYLTNPNSVKDFVNYSGADVYYLSYINEYFCKGMNDIMAQLGFPTKYFFDKIPTTVGSISSHFLKSFISSSFETYKTEDGTHINLLSDFKSLSTEIGHILFYKSKRKKKTKKNIVSTFVSGASIRTIATDYATNSGLLNVLTSGGRAFNERYEEYRGEHVLDMDFKSCYGSCLNRFEYPLGLPFIYAVTSKQPKQKFGEFLETYESELVDNFYTITISRKLSFRQTFLYSRIINQKSLEKRITDIILENEGDCEVDGNDTSADMVILEKELVNTVITSDTLRILRELCSSQELNEFYRCDVETSLFYRKSDHTSDLNVFISRLKEELKNPLNTREYNTDRQCTSDRRPRIWTSLKLSNFIDPLLKLRNDYKQKEKHAKSLGDLKLQDDFKLKQILIKTIVNSVYGIVTSSFLKFRT